MKLPDSELTSAEKLAEFDQWITPSIQEIQDTDKYKAELRKIDSLILSLGEATNEFSSIKNCKPDQIASTCVGLIKSDIRANRLDADGQANYAAEIIDSLASLLFMVTGKSDNNLKCQFPVFLAQNYKSHDFPQKSLSRKKVAFKAKSLGRTIKSNKLAKVIAEALVYSVASDEFHYLEGKARWLLGKYIEAILKDSESIKQFWALGNSYFTLRKLGQNFEQSLIAPIIIFKIRGSVSASGGHIPEDLLRKMMENWGMERGVDFNLDDVVLDDATSSDVSKTRAYDFVLPYKTQGWVPHIFIQCQFYAGDSGSVSHKVVDQTKSSRPLILKKYVYARFIEYLDGAGYYSSLNTDLQHMLGMDTTREFIQIRSANLKLRRELQTIGFLTPLEIEHAIFQSRSGTKQEVEALLEKDGYSKQEIRRSVDNAINRGLICVVGNTTLTIDSRRIAFARRLLLVDITASIGDSLVADAHQGSVMIPGYGACFGVSLGMLSGELDDVAPNLDYSRNDFANDLNWLIDQQLILIR